MNKDLGKVLVREFYKGILSIERPNKEIDNFIEDFKQYKALFKSEAIESNFGLDEYTLSQTTNLMNTLIYCYERYNGNYLETGDPATMINNTMEKLVDIIKNSYSTPERKSPTEIIFMYDLISESIDGKYYGHNLLGDLPKEEICKEDIKSLAAHFYNEMQGNGEIDWESKKLLKLSRKLTAILDLLNGKKRTVDLWEDN